MIRPLLAAVVAICLVISTQAFPDNIEDVKNLPEKQTPIIESEESQTNVRKERCSTCTASASLNLNGPGDVLAAIQSIPGAEIHTQSTFEGCSSDKGCAGLKVKDGRVLEKFGDVNAFRAAIEADTGNEFTFHPGKQFGSAVFEGGIPKDGPFWWMNQDSPFKNVGQGNYEKFSKSSSFSSSASTGAGGEGGFGGSVDLTKNPFLNGDISKLAAGFANSGASQIQGEASFGKPSSTSFSEYESSSFSTSNKGEVDISKNPFLNKNQGGFQASFGGSAPANSFASGSKYSGFTGSSPSPFTASTAGAYSQKNEFEFEQQQQNIDEAFAGTGNVHAHEHAGGELQQTCAGQGYVCVHKAQCNNGVVNTNGAGILQAKTKKQYCNTKTEICCRIEISTLRGTGGLQGSLGVGSATFSSSGGQGSGLFASSGQTNSNSFGSGSSQGENTISGQKGYGATGQAGSFGASGQAGSFGASGQAGSFGASGQAGSFGASGQGGAFGATGKGNSFSSTKTSFESSSFGANRNKFGNNQGGFEGGQGSFGATAQGSQGTFGATAQGSQGTFGATAQGSQGSFGTKGAGAYGSNNVFGAGSGNKGFVETSSSSFETSTRGSNFGNSGNDLNVAGSFGSTGSPFGSKNAGSFNNANEVFIKETQNTQTNFVDTDSFSSGSENAGVYRPGANRLKPGVPYLPPVDNVNSGSSVVSSTQFVSTTARPVYTTSKPTYLPPSTAAPGYLPPQEGEQTINTETRIPPNKPTYDEGQLILDENRQPSRPKQPAPAPNEIPAGCAAALKCTPIEYCTAEGVISNTTIALTRDQEAYRVPLTDCKDLETGRVGKCCRDPNYSDPWPVNLIGKWTSGVFGGNDGKYTPDNRGSPNNPRPSVTAKPPVTGSVLLNNFRTPKPTTTPTLGPNQVTPGFPSSTISQSTIGQKGQYEIRGQGQYTQGGQGQYAQGGQGQYTQGGQGQYTQRGQGQFGIGAQGQIGQGAQGQFGQGGQSQFTSSSQYNIAQTGQKGQGQLVQQGQGQIVSQGQGQIISQGQGQYVQQGKGQAAIVGQGAEFTQQAGQRGQGQFVSQGQGQLVTQGQGQLVTQGQGQVVTQGQGQIVSQGQFGQGQFVSEGQGQGIRQGQGFAVSQSGGFGVENDYSESVQRVFLQRYNAGGQCGIFNGQKPFGNRNELEVDFAEIPWQAMVLLQTNRSLLCGGVITRPDVVITTASCVEGLIAKNVLIKGGEWKLGIDDEPLPFQIVQVKTILRHPNYRHDTLLNDVAILVLAENLRLAKNIFPICLPGARETLDAFYNGAGECIVTGWGKQVLQAHLAGNIMHSLNVSLINPGECQAKLSQEYPALLQQYDQDTCACGQPTNPINNICKVDTGSALACTTGDGHYVLRGIYSWDSGCQPGNQVAAFYKFDLEWYEWAIGLLESAKYGQFSVGQLQQNKFAGQINNGGNRGQYSGIKGGSGVKGFSSSSSKAQFGGFGGQFALGGAGVGISGGVGQFGQFGKITEGVAADQGLGFNGQIKAPIQNSFSASYSEKKVFQSEPKYVTYTTKPEIVTFTTKPEIFTYTTKPKIVTYTTKPQIVTYTTKPQFITYETSGSGQNPQYVAPGVTYNPQFGELVGNQHQHNAQCRCFENGKK